MKPKQFILTATLLTLTLFGLYGLLFIFQLGAPSVAEYWVADIYRYKDYKAHSLTSKKMMIVSGSNSLFGIDGSIIKEKTGYEVVNLSAHVGLDIDFLHYKIAQHMKEGDVVVMPLEFELYYGSGQLTDWFSNNMMSWGEDYLKSLSIIDALAFVVETEPTRVFEGVINGLKAPSETDKVAPLHEVLETLKTSWEQGVINTENYYSYKRLDQFGDILVDEKVSYTPMKREYLPDLESISPHFLEGYRKIARLVRANNGTLILTYPITIRNESFDLSKADSQHRVAKLEALLGESGIEIKCNAALFNLDRAYFYDTHYHANKYGALIRSENLGDCLSELLAGGDSKKTDATAISQTKLLEFKFIHFVDDAVHLKRINELTLIKKSLQKYYSDFGVYPKSVGYDGPYSPWGYSGKNWIKGLVPEYMKELPFSLRADNQMQIQYLYKSDGNDFKLISHTGDDCKKVKEIQPALVDPVRDCGAYGFWTEGAVNW